jgi:putative hemolysin
MTGQNEADLHDFSYTDARAPGWKRKTTRLVELLTGQPYFVNLYLSWHDAAHGNETFFAAALRLLDIDLAYDEVKLAAWPQTGPLLIVCNHPYGVIDGFAACHLALKRRGDVRILINAVLNCLDEIKPYGLPVDFAETKQALRVNLQTRQAALQHVRDGGCLIVFPAGGISTTPRLFSRKAEDAPWKTFVARLARESRAPVAPLFFPGQNSRFFQLASHLSMDLRLALMFRETRRRMGQRIEAQLGDVLPFECLARFNRVGLTQHLRDVVYTLERES